MRKRISLLAIVAVFALIVAACSTSGDDTTTTTVAAATETTTTGVDETATTEADVMDSTSVLDLAVEAGQFSTLIAAIDAAGLADTLEGEGPFTVLAPTDAAFAEAF